MAELRLVGAWQRERRQFWMQRARLYKLRGWNSSVETAVRFARLMNRHLVQVLREISNRGY